LKIYATDSRKAYFFRVSVACLSAISGKHEIHGNSNGESAGKPKIFVFCEIRRIIAVETG
jgi:hypothetical protein